MAGLLAAEEAFANEGQVDGGKDAPPASMAAEATDPELDPVAVPTKSFRWQGEWQGWEGYRFELRVQTLLGRWIPSVTNLPPLRPEVGWQLPEGPPERPLQLEEARFSGKLGAKVALDAAAFAAEDSAGDFDPGAELRRARIYLRGDCQILLPVSYELEVGYIPGRIYLENSYLEFRHLGFLGSLKVGQYQAPMTLVNYGSSRDMMFMEPAAPIQALAPGVEAGLQVGRPVLDQRATWAIGTFTQGIQNDYGDATKDFGRLVTRFTGLVFREVEEGVIRRLLHVGVSGYGVYAGGNSVRYRTRPESHLAPFVLDTGEIPADAAFVLGTEVAWVNGPVSVQGEFLRTWLDQGVEGIGNLHGFYASASWFLTGETRPYDPVMGTFTRVIPRRNLSFSTGGWGAWELAARYSVTDLDSGHIRGGRLGMGMAGVNWYPHSHVKWRFNYGLGVADGEVSDGIIHVFQTRLEVDL